jgi:hypothetical protein
LLDLRGPERTYSCRAEGLVDFARFLLVANEYVWMVRVGGDRDVEIQFDSRLGLAALRSLLEEVADTHVMRQTLRACPLSENDLERDFDVG